MRCKASVPGGGILGKGSFFLYFLKIEVWLIYNGVLVSGVHQSDSVYIYTHLLLFQIPFPYSYCKTLSLVPC